MKLTIVGASGHGKVVAEIARLNGYNEIVFYDDNPTLRACGCWPVVGTTDQLTTEDSELFIAIGNANVRERFMERFSDVQMPVLIHPSAVVAPQVPIGRGSVVMPGAVINPGSVLGEGVIVNTCASVDHDCVLGDYVHVAVGAHLCGTIEVGVRTWIGAGAIVSNNHRVCKDVMLAAGALVVADIDEPGVYIGSPAKLYRKQTERQGS